MRHGIGRHQCLGPILAINGEDEEISLRNEKGFSLLELLFVVLIIGIVASIAIPQLTESKIPAYDATAKSDLKNVITALEMYSIRNGTYPASESDLLSSGFSLSSGVSFTRYTLETKDGVQNLHMHVQHVNSPNAWHVKYPEEGTQPQIR